MCVFPSTVTILLLMSYSEARVEPFTDSVILL